MTLQDVLKSVVATLQPLGLGYVMSRGWTHSEAGPWVPISSPLTHIVYLLPLLVIKQAPKAFPSTRPGNDDKYRSRRYRFERQTSITD